MNDQATFFTAIILAALLYLVAWAVWRGIKVHRSRKLKERFGPEYDIAQAKYGRQADTELHGRLKRVEQLPLRSLTREQAARFEATWRAALKRFIDDPALAVAEADHLLMEVMEALGYPKAEIDRRTADLSVHHPHVVRDYRIAHSIATKSKSGLASTEEMRESMVHFRTVVQELVPAAPAEAEQPEYAHR